jgi:hypothetical protein
MVELICLTCGEGFETSTYEIKRGRRFCSHKCADTANRGRVGPMKGRTHTPEARRKISDFQKTHPHGKRQQPNIDAMIEHNRVNGPWNKKYDDPNQRFQIYRDNHKEERKAINKYYHKEYQFSWNGYRNQTWKNLVRTNKGLPLPYSMEEFFKWFDTLPKTCYLCGDPLEPGDRRVQLDHITSRKQGGTSESCKMCNQIKDSFSIQEVIQRVEKWKERL